MYKLKNSFIDKMIEKNLTSKEIDFLLHIGKFQDDYGRVYGVYYKDMCAELNMSVQKFYDLLTSLKTKGIIDYVKAGRFDYTVILKDNDFSDYELNQGYLNLSSKQFNSLTFKSLKAGAKLFYLYMQRFASYGQKMLVKTFYSKFCSMLNCTKKTLQTYILTLKKFFYINVCRKRNGSYKYEIAIKTGNALDIPSPLREFEKECYLNNIKTLISRNFNAMLPDTNSASVIADIANLSISDQASKHKNIIELVINAIKASRKRQLKENKKPKLNAALVNKHLKDILFMKDMGLKDIAG